MLFKPSTVCLSKVSRPCANRGCQASGISYPGGPCVSIDMAQGTATSPELQGPGLGGLRRYERRARYSKQYE